MLLLFSHQLTKNQKVDARANWSVESFVALPEELQNIWSNIDPDLESLEEYLLPIYNFLETEATLGDIVLVQGDFGACCLMAKYSRTIGAIPVYATTSRLVSEYTEDGKNIKKSIFEHRRFREYE